MHFFVYHGVTFILFVNPVTLCCSLSVKTFASLTENGTHYEMLLKQESSKTQLMDSVILLSYN